MKIVVGLSGGVDSSVAAYLLKEAGHEVSGLFMINWHDTTGTLSGDCPWEEDLLIAKLVAHRLGIPFHQVDLSEPYRERVVDYMFSEYEKGRTPNPDVLCNREIKFDLFIGEAEKLGADMVATGHYCRKETIVSGGKTLYRLLGGMDRNKDQSYFLCQLSQSQLEKVIFPLGGLKKPEVRNVASGLQLASSMKKDSQGICFVGKVDLPSFLQQKLSVQKGRVIGISADDPVYLRQNRDHIEACLKEGNYHDITSPIKYSPEQGKPAGEHRGAHFFTIGQRKGLQIGGRKEPLFVIATDTENKLLYVGQGKDHPGLFRHGLFIPAEDMHWIRPDLEIPAGGSGEYLVRIRYRQPLQKATMFMQKEGAHLVFQKAQRGITPGQFAAWYLEDELVGSGVIG